MFILSLIFSPFTFGFDAYNSMHDTFPLSIRRRNRQSLIYKNDRHYDTILKKIPGADIKVKMKPFLDAQRIRKDLIIVETKSHCFCAASGNNDFTTGQAVIYSHPGFYKLDKDACGWVMKHEICHIKNNDNFMNPLISSICSISTAIFSYTMMPLIPSWIIAVAIGNIADLILCQYMEVMADEFATSTSTTPELKGGRRLLIALAEAQSSPTCDLKFNFTHPSTASRLEKIEKELKSRNITVNKDQEKVLIKRIKTLMTEWMNNL